MKKTNDRIRVIRVRRRTNPSSGGLSVVVIIFVIRVNSCRFVIKHKTKTPSGFAVATALWAVRNPHVTAHRAVATTFVFLRVN